MPTLGREFLQALANPPLNQGLFNLGAAVGGVPGQYKEKRFQTELANIDTTTLAGQIEAQQKRLSRETDPVVVLNMQKEIRRLRDEEKESEQFGTLSEIYTQGIKAAQGGNLVVLDEQIAKFSEMLNAPGLAIEQKQSISRQINDLTKLRPAAKEANETNETKELLDLSRRLKDTTLSDSERVQIQERINTIRKNPAVVQKYQQSELGRMQFNAAEEDRLAGKWLDENKATINAFIEEGDDKGLDDFIKGAGKYIDDAQAFATSALQYREYQTKVKEQNNSKKREPNLDLYKEQLDLLPEELKKNLGPVFKAYEERAKKWDPKTKTWEGGAASRTAAMVLEKQLQQQITAAQQTASTATFNDNRVEKNRIDLEIFEAKLALDAADTLTNEDRNAARLKVNSIYQGVKRTSEIRKKIEAEVAEEEQRILRDNKRAATERLDYLNNFGKEKPVNEPTEANIEASKKWNLQGYADFTIEENSIIEGAIKRYSVSRERTIRLLIKAGKIQLPEETRALEKPEEPEKWDMRRASGFVAKMEDLGPREERMANSREKRANINE